MSITNESSVYLPVPEGFIEQNADLQSQVAGQAQSNHYVESFLTRTLGSSCSGRLKDLKHRTLLLDNSLQSRKGLDRRPRKRKSLSSRERRDLKLFDIKPEEQKYELYIPLHKLWTSYINDLIDFSKVTAKGVQEVEKKMLKADYHGSIVTVTKSKCASLVGTTGIVLQETKNTMKVITKENRLKTIPKAHTVFTLDLQGHLLTIYGNNFCYKASDRSTRNFKSKPTIDL